jgi:3-hydroxyacyl-[acyl-carrier-protein] dehydratase
MIPNLYKIISISTSGEESVSFEIQINSECEIFDGHFPGQPVLPGVCTLEIIKDCISNIRHNRVMLSGISQCKFTGMVDPRVENILKIDINIKSCGKDIPGSVNAAVSASERVILKLKGEYNDI